MERVTFMQWIKPGCQDDYVRYHDGSADLWPELVTASKAAGIHNYTGFIGGPDGRVVVGYFETPDLGRVQSELGSNPVNVEWSKLMVPLMESGGDLSSGAMPFLRPIWRMD